MDWEKRGKQVIHKSGFRLTVNHGSFETPFEISYEQGDELSPIELARMIRSGLYQGRLLEVDAQRNKASASSHANGNQRATQVVTKRRRAYR
jgi:hypothetical protein